jgi:hypothetical protein
MHYDDLHNEKQYRANIAALASEAFAHHVLVQEAEGRWRCEKPGTGFYRFWVLFTPRHIVVVGDVSSIILHPTDRPLPWLLGSVENLRYCLEKLDPATRERVFLVKEARRYIAEAKKDGGHEFKKLLRLAAEFRERMGYEDDPRRAWVESWIEVMGDTDFPDCDDWGPGVLWPYHALRTFCRLYRAAEARTAQEGGAA